MPPKGAYRNPSEIQTQPDKTGQTRNRLHPVIFRRNNEIAAILPLSDRRENFWKTRTSHPNTKGAQASGNPESGNPVPLGHPHRRHGHPSQRGPPETAKSGRV
jgi:hypothetical protein